jgi:hypothetical protein
LKVVAGADVSERKGIAAERAKAVADYLLSNWQVARERIKLPDETEGQRTLTLRLETAAEK